MKTTKQAARAARISRQTLQEWIDSKKIKAPKKIPVGRTSPRMWTEHQVRDLVAFARKRRNAKNRRF